MACHLIHWDSSLETGVLIIDEQHKRLIEIYNNLVMVFENRS